MDWTLPVAKNMYEPSDRHLDEPYVMEAPGTYQHTWIVCFEDCDFGAHSEEEANEIMDREKITRRLQEL